MLNLSDEKGARNVNGKGRQSYEDACNTELIQRTCLLIGFKAFGIALCRFVYFINPAEDTRPDRAQPLLYITSARDTLIRYFSNDTNSNDSICPHCLNITLHSFP